MGSSPREELWAESPHYELPFYCPHTNIRNQKTRGPPFPPAQSPRRLVLAISDPLASTTIGTGLQPACNIAAWGEYPAELLTLHHLIGTILKKYSCELHQLPFLARKMEYTVVVEGHSSDPALEPLLATLREYGRGKIVLFTSQPPGRQGEEPIVITTPAVLILKRGLLATKPLAALLSPYQSGGPRVVWSDEAPPVWRGDFGQLGDEVPVPASTGNSKVLPPVFVPGRGLRSQAPEKFSTRPPRASGEPQRNRPHTSGTLHRDGTPTMFRIPILPKTEPHCSNGVCFVGTGAPTSGPREPHCSDGVCFVGTGGPKSGPREHPTPQLGQESTPLRQSPFGADIPRPEPQERRVKFTIPRKPKPPQGRRPPSARRSHRSGRTCSKCRKRIYGEDKVQMGDLDNTDIPRDDPKSAKSPQPDPELYAFSCNSKAIDAALEWNSEDAWGGSATFADVPLSIPPEIVLDLIAPRLTPRNLPADLADQRANPPLVSCLMVTKGNPKHVRRAVECYWRQTHPRRELVIVTDPGGKDAILAALNSKGENRAKLTIGTDPSIKWVEGEKGESLGVLRNKSVETATGDYLIQWDDDDHYHPSRIGVMLRLLRQSKRKACFLGHWLLAAPAQGLCVLSPLNKSGWEGSAIFQKGASQGYPSKRKGEDTAWRNDLCAQCRDGVCSVEPPCLVIKDQRFAILYIYAYHGGNTWNEDHFMKIARRGSPLYRIPDSGGKEAALAAAATAGALLGSEQPPTHYSKSLRSLPQDDIAIAGAAIGLIVLLFIIAAFSRRFP